MAGRAAKPGRFRRPLVVPFSILREPEREVDQGEPTGDEALSNTRGTVTASSSRS